MRANSKHAISATLGQGGQFWQIAQIVGKSAPYSNRHGCCGGLASTKRRAGLLEEIAPDQLQRHREVCLQRLAEADQEIVAINDETLRPIERIGDDRGREAGRYRRSGDNCDRRPAGPRAS